jgi:hypothetical protein
VWETVFSLLTDLVSLRRDLQTRVEQEWEAHGDPVAQARAWAAKLAQLECKRDEYQGMFAAEAMTLDELKARLEVLKETCEASEKELAALAGRSGRLL